MNAGHDRLLIIPNTEPVLYLQQVPVMIIKPMVWSGSWSRSSAVGPTDLARSREVPLAITLLVAAALV